MRRNPTLIRLLGWTVVLVATSESNWRREHDPEQSFSALGLNVERNISYRNQSGRHPSLDLYLPERADSPQFGFPAIVLVHGGSWIGGSKSNYRVDPWRNATRLAQHGFVVVAVDYLQARPTEPSWPEALEDLKASVRWTRRNAGKFRVDPNKIAILGQGSGAHLALMLGTEQRTDFIEDESAAVQAVISMYGPTDLRGLVESRKTERDSTFTFLGGSQTNNLPDRLERASPVRRITASTCPTLLIHGADDLWVPPEQSRKMAAALEKAGVFHRLILVEGARHGFETIVESSRKLDLLPDILAFLSNVWNVSGRMLHRDLAPTRANIYAPQRAATRDTTQSLPFDATNGSAHSSRLDAKFGDS